MTSRTTKQAARAYQKAHGVPYAEALRIVMSGEHPHEGTQSPTDGTTEGPEPAQLPAVISLGQMLLPRSAMVESGTEVPLAWPLTEDARHPQLHTLGVYGGFGAGKSFYVATLLQRNLRGVPTLVASAAKPSAYLAQEGLMYHEPGLHEMSQAAVADLLAPEVVVKTAVERGAVALVYDRGLLAHEDEAQGRDTLRRLVECASIATESSGPSMLLVFTCLEERPIGGMQDAAVVLTPHTVAGYPAVHASAHDRGEAVPLARVHNPELAAALSGR